MPWRGFLWPPEGEKSTPEAIRWWQRAISANVHVLSLFALGALGAGAFVGLPWAGFATAAQAQANAKAIQDLGLVVRCSAMQTGIDGLRREIFELQRDIDIAGDDARLSDRQRLAQRAAELMDRQQRFNVLGCPAVLD